MSLTVTVDSNAVERALKTASDAVAKELRVSMKEALQGVVKQAKSTHKFQTRHGQLERSIKFDVDALGVNGRVYLDTGICPYAPYVHEGTGVHGGGKGAYPIKPVSRQSLHWVKNGNSVFSKGVMAQGQKPDPFLTKAFDQQEPFIQAKMQQAVNRAIKIAGL